MSVAWRAYRLVAPWIGALAPAARVLTSPHERVLWSERLGRVAPTGGCDAWIHAASLGETVGVAPLARALAALEPGASFFLTAMTRAGRQRLATGAHPVALAPLDAPQVVGGFLDRVAPRRIVLVETELWPHWLLAARARSLPVAVVSARLTDRSVRRYRALGAAMRELVGGLDAVCCQTTRDAERWLAIGASPARTEVTGNLKDDGLPQPAPSRASARAELGLDRDRPLLVLASLRPGEPGLLARAWRALPVELRAGWQVVAVPRHARAARELRDEIAAASARRPRSRASTARGAGDPHGPDTWRWETRAGVLAAYYAAADVAFVGGSLTPFGGHNPLEPAACGAAVLMGPHHASQQDAVDALRARDAIVVAADAEGVTAALAVWLDDAVARRRAGEDARAVAKSQRGAASRTAARLATWGFWPVDARPAAAPRGRA
jgi:3-deoxy-D-manno-octulosonic-acid transferase